MKNMNWSTCVCHSSMVFAREQLSWHYMFPFQGEHTRLGHGSCAWCQRGFSWFVWLVSPTFRKSIGRRSIQTIPSANYISWLHKIFYLRPNALRPSSKVDRLRRMNCNHWHRWYSFLWFSIMYYMKQEVPWIVGQNNFSMTHANEYYLVLLCTLRIEIWWRCGSCFMMFSPVKRGVRHIRHTYSSLPPSSRTVTGSILLIYMRKACWPIAAMGCNYSTIFY